MAVDNKLKLAPSSRGNLFQVVLFFMQVGLPFTLEIADSNKHFCSHGDVPIITNTSIVFHCGTRLSTIPTEYGGSTLQQQNSFEYICTDSI